MGSDKEMEKNNAYSRNTELYIVARQKKRCEEEKLVSLERFFRDGI